MIHRFIFLLFIISTSAMAQNFTPKSLSELINTEEPGWKLVEEWIKEGKNKIEVLPKIQARAEKALLESQVTTRSPMGAIVYETGGILVDDGWIRILGSGSERFDRSLIEWNQGKSFINSGEQPAYLLIADDVLGGFFAINNGAFGKDESGKIFYFAPESLTWESLGIGYSDFIYFCFSGDLDKFYKGFRWMNWEKDVRGLDANMAFSLMPYPWTKEGKNINKVTRKAVPIQELWNLYMDNE
ncbi:MAG TPA: DUF2625 domain-containing protein [Cytophagales bacterium]|nr:DUF2625 domain-containing protein [Cytophagales bacterium]